MTLAVVGITVAVRTTANARWVEMQDWMAVEQSAWETRDSCRPALWGETRPGNAFVHYDEAEELASELLRTLGAHGLNALRHQPEEVSIEEAEELRSAWAPAVAAMRAGAHCEDARSPVRFEEGFFVDMRNLLAGRWTVNMACLEANDLLTAGHAREAVECTLDAATYGADLVQSPMVIDQMIGNALIAIATRGQWTAERLDQLDAPALKLLALGLQRLDDHVPVTTQLRGEALLMAHSFASVTAVDRLDVSAISAWNYGFSMRWMIADAVRQITQALDRLDESAGQPWPRRALALEEQKNELSESDNTIVQLGWSHLLVAERSRRHVAAELRILRIGVDARLGRELSELEDPLGDGALEVLETDGGLRIASDAADDDRYQRLVLEVARPTPR